MVSPIVQTNSEELLRLFDHKFVAMQKNARAALSVAIGQIDTGARGCGSYY
jgi:hypothetical protein|tara:strand:- start:161 stop:313 length:153 start_codon:yes stop_codon:yes gene_type:complete